jgi:hypothetical protein
MHSRHSVASRPRSVANHCDAAQGFVSITGPINCGHPSGEDGRAQCHFARDGRIQASSSADLEEVLANIDIGLKTKSPNAELFPIAPVQELIRVPSVKDKDIQHVGVMFLFRSRRDPCDQPERPILPTRTSSGHLLSLPY